MVQSKLYEPHLKSLTHQIIFHNPINNPKLNSSKRKLLLVPYHKSLFNSPKGKGLPIGNLTSQFFANIYLNRLDQFVKRNLKVKFYGRYVDDLILIHKSPSVLNY